VERIENDYETLDLLRHISNRLFMPITEFAFSDFAERGAALEIAATQGAADRLSDQPRTSEKRLGFESTRLRPAHYDCGQ